MEYTATFNAQFREGEEIKATFSDGANLEADFGEIQKVSTTNYNDLYNKPQIEGVTLQGNKTFPDLGLGTLTAQEIDTVIFGG